MIMIELIANCVDELDANRGYYRTLPLFLLLNAGDRLDADPIDRFVTGIEQILGLLLFVFVVVPLGLMGKVVKQ